MRLTLVAWLQLAFTICGVFAAIAMIRLLVDGGNTMACFDGDRLACGAAPIGLGDMPRAVIAGATLIAAAATAVVLAHLHRRRVVLLGALGVSVALNFLAAVAFFSV